MFSSNPWKSIKIHSPVFVGLFAVIFVAFRALFDIPIWNDLDFEVLMDACRLGKDPGPMFGHLGFYFSQPLVQVLFLLEYNIFETNPAGYFAVNLFFHTMNSFVVFMLVNMLFPRRHMAHLAAFLFAMAVGNYGKIFMTIHQLESLLLATLHLLILYLFIRNDFRRGGALRSPFFVLGLFLFLMTGLTKSSIFSLVGCLVAYKFFFSAGRGWRVVLSPDIQVIVVVSILYYWAQGQWGYQQPAIFNKEHPLQIFSFLSVKNLFQYLILMFFPVQSSGLIDTVPNWVQWILDGRLLVRIFLALSIVSYSFFGLVFGNRAVRFFVAWTYITLLPFTGHSASGSWLNLTHLYLTSLGFCVILAAGAVGTSNLLRIAGWRRFAPYTIPMLFVLLSLGLTSRFEARNRIRAESSEVLIMQKELTTTCGSPLIVPDSP